VLAVEIGHVALIVCSARRQLILLKAGVALEIFYIFKAILSELLFIDSLQVL